mmetsp:Transcript_51120/g.101234  ORF Transcript_51120/g.101234 Transcript_51120/m.101234 type:complete len:479 (-) Transcript_51120:28-1464(-)
MLRTLWGIIVAFYYHFILTLLTTRLHMSAACAAGSLFGVTMTPLDPAAATAETAGRPPARHLVVFVHGLGGSGRDFDILLELTRGALKVNDVHLYCCRCNEHLLGTFDGIETGGSRVAKEIETIAKKLGIQELSIVGHSLGGMYARYALKVLDASGLLEGLELVSFVTVATPHLGIRRPQGILRYPLSTVFQVGASHLPFLRSAHELCLTERRAGNSEPLLFKMATDPSFLRPLWRFHSRVLYSNVKHDFQVPYCTGAILAQNPYRTRRHPPENGSSEDNSINGDTLGGSGAAVESTGGPRDEAADEATLSEKNSDSSSSGVQTSHPDNVKGPPGLPYITAASLARELIGSAPGGEEADAGARSATEKAMFLRDALRDKLIPMLRGLGGGHGNDTSSDNDDDDEGSSVNNSCGGGLGRALRPKEGLRSMQWRRIDVAFDGHSAPFKAHEWIVGKNAGAKQIHVARHIAHEIATAASGR